MPKRLISFYILKHESETPEPSSACEFRWWYTLLNSHEEESYESLQMNEMGNKIGNEGVMKLLASLPSTFPPTAAHCPQSPSTHSSFLSWNGTDCLPPPVSSSVSTSLYCLLALSFSFTPSLLPPSSLSTYLLCPPLLHLCLSVSLFLPLIRQAVKHGESCIQRRQQEGSTGPWNAGNRDLRDYRAEAQWLN